jgi:hypothetical protein
MLATSQVVASCVSGFGNFVKADRRNRPLVIGCAERGRAGFALADQSVVVENDNDLVGVLLRVVRTAALISESRCFRGWPAICGQVEKERRTYRCECPKSQAADREIDSFLATELLAAEHRVRSPGSPLDTAALDAFCEKLISADSGLAIRSRQLAYLKAARAVANAVVRL